MAQLKVMMIRHGEKPTVKHQPPYGVTEDGEQDWESLTAQGWQRAGALVTLFAPARGALPGPLARPTAIYASKPRAGGPGEENGSKSKRPLQTVAPLAEKLELTPDQSFGKGEEQALAAALLGLTGSVLVSWQHERVDEIARHLTAGAPLQAPLPKWPDERFDLVWIFDAPAANGRWSFAQLPQNLLPGDRNSVA